MSIRLLVVLMLVGCSPTVYTHGVPNLAQVNANIWRSGQITTHEGWDYVHLLAAGRHVHVVKLNFTAEGADDPDSYARSFLRMDFDYEPIQPEGDVGVWDDVLNIWKGPDPSRVNDADTTLAVCLIHPDTDFCLVHCTHGQDRTGYVVGRFRVLHDGWTKHAAYQEMLAHHFHPELPGIHEAWENFKGP
jgi:hypothetical protein